MRFRLLLLLLFACVQVTALAQSPSSDEVASTERRQPDGSREEPAPFVPNTLPSLHVSRAPAAIKIDGDLSDAGWKGAARAGNFAETSPGDLVRPPVNTEALVTYDNENLYVGFICHDDPTKIRATMHDRDEMWNEDMIGIILDTYGNSSWAYEIYTNARGIQGDILWTSNNEDTRFDLVFTSQAKITPDGYQVEMAIPFNSLRFPDQPEQNWRTTFWRIHPRDSRGEYSWAAINRDDPCSFCQYGTLTGIRDVRPGGSLELLPAVISSQSAERGPQGTLVNSNPSVNASLGARYAFSPSLSGEATVNPDFSQVESDAAQIDVNSTFALSYPEKRPFFQEGGDLFNTWISGVYTRSINEPLAGVKLVGRMGATSVGYIGAYDRNMPLLVPFEEFSTVETGTDTLPNIRSVTNIVRVQHTIANSSYIGLLATDARIIGGGSGTLAGVDGSLRFLNNYSIDLQALFSHTAEPNDRRYSADINGLKFDHDRHTADFDGERFGGHGFYAGINRRSRDWEFNVHYKEKSPTFRAANGFVYKNNSREVEGWTGYNLYPDISFIDKFVPSIDVARVFDFDWVRKDEWLSPMLNFNLKGQTHLSLSYIFSNELFRGHEYSGIRRLQVDFNSEFTSMFSGGFWFSPGRYVARSISDSVLGSGMEFNVWTTFKPLEQFNIQPQFSHSILHYPDGHPKAGDIIFDEWVFRARMNYQFTRELSLRMVAQYFTEDKSISIEPLLSYKLNPFTIFYVGSSHALDENPASKGFSERSRQFFAKLQYLMQV